MKTDIRVSGLADHSCNSNALLDALFGSGNYSLASIFFFSGFKGEVASAIQVMRGYLVLKGSIAATRESADLPLGIRKLRHDLKRRGVIIELDDRPGYMFLEPHLFRNEIEATRVICGNAKDRKCPAERVWRDSLGRQPLEYRVEDNIIVST